MQLYLAPGGGGVRRQRHAYARLATGLLKNDVREGSDQPGAGETPSGAIVPRK